MPWPVPLAGWWILSGVRAPSGWVGLSRRPRCVTELRCRRRGRSVQRIGACAAHWCERPALDVVAVPLPAGARCRCAGCVRARGRVLCLTSWQRQRNGQQRACAIGVAVGVGLSLRPRCVTELRCRREAAASRKSGPALHLVPCLMPWPCCCLLVFSAVVLAVAGCSGAAVASWRRQRIDQRACAISVAVGPAPSSPVV